MSAGEHKAKKDELLELMAYADGELTGEERGRVVRRLASDAAWARAGTTERRDWCSR